MLSHAQLQWAPHDWKVHQSSLWWPALFAQETKGLRKHELTVAIGASRRLKRHLAHLQSAVRLIQQWWSNRCPRTSVTTAKDRHCQRSPYLSRCMQRKRLWATWILRRLNYRLPRHPWALCHAAINGRRRPWLQAHLESVKLTLLWGQSEERFPQLHDYGVASGLLRLWPCWLWPTWVHLSH